jgi:organic hydroperoxide reductase OsmC/OhrA
VSARPRVFEFGVTVDRERVARSALGGSALAREDEWWPEHLVLAALVRCSLGSLEFYARRAGVEVEGSGSAHGRVTRREEDGLFAFVEIEAAFDVELAGELGETERGDLLEKAERGCFVSNSLTARPRTRWVVNGQEVA